MLARRIIPIGLARDMEPGMALGTAPVIGEIPSGTMALPTALWVLAGTVDMADSARYAHHPACLALVRHFRLTRLRNSERNHKRLHYFSVHARGLDEAHAAV
jgi:hypothetical protein